MNADTMSPAVGALRLDCRVLCYDPVPEDLNCCHGILYFRLFDFWKHIKPGWHSDPTQTHRRAVQIDSCWNN